MGSLPSFGDICSDVRRWLTCSCLCGGSGTTSSSEQTIESRREDTDVEVHAVFNCCNVGRETAVDPVPLSTRSVTTSMTMESSEERLARIARAWDERIRQVPEKFRHQVEIAFAKHRRENVTNYEERIQAQVANLEEISAAKKKLRLLESFEAVEEKFSMPGSSSIEGVPPWLLSVTPKPCKGHRLSLPALPPEEGTLAIRHPPRLPPIPRLSGDRSLQDIPEEPIDSKYSGASRAQYADTSLTQDDEEFLIQTACFALSKLVEEKITTDSGVITRKEAIEEFKHYLNIAGIKFRVKTDFALNLFIKNAIEKLFLKFANEKGKIDILTSLKKELLEMEEKTRGHVVHKACVLHFTKFEDWKKELEDLQGKYDITGKNGRKKTISTIAQKIRDYPKDRALTEEDILRIAYFVAKDLAGKEATSKMVLDTQTEYLLINGVKMDGRYQRALKGVMPQVVGRLYWKLNPSDEEGLERLTTFARAVNQIPSPPLSSAGSDNSDSTGVARTPVSSEDLRSS